MKKGRVNDATRPQPTIYGNCDSWDFIVGKKRLDPSLATELPCRRDAAENVLSTGYQQIQKDNMGESCGRAVDFQWIARPHPTMWAERAFLLPSPTSEDRQFYPNSYVTDRPISDVPAGSLRRQLPTVTVSKKPQHCFGPEVSTQARSSRAETTTCRATA